MRIELTSKIVDKMGEMTESINLITEALTIIGNNQVDLVKNLKKSAKRINLLEAMYAELGLHHLETLVLSDNKEIRDYAKERLKAEDDE